MRRNQASQIVKHLDLYLTCDVIADPKVNDIGFPSIFFSGVGLLKLATGPVVLEITEEGERYKSLQISSQSVVLQKHSSQARINRPCISVYRWKSGRVHCNWAFGSTHWKSAATRRNSPRAAAAAVDTRRDELWFVACHCLPPYRGVGGRPLLSSH